MNTQPLISIIIPTFERPNYLERACKTASKQTYKNIEIIVVDDNSTLSYQNALSNLSHLPLTYIKRSENGGGSAARNTGIKSAKGDFIAFLDDDDIWETNKLELQIAGITPNLRASHCGYSVKSNGKIRIEDKGTITLDDLRENNKLAGTTGLLCESSIIKQLMFDESLHRSQDWDLYLRIAEVTAFYYVRHPLYVYDDGDHSRMSNRFAELSIEQYKLKLDMLKKHRETLHTDAYNNHVAELILPSLKNRSDKVAIVKFCIEEIGLSQTLSQFIRISVKKLMKKIS